MKNKKITWVSILIVSFLLLFNIPYVSATEPDFYLTSYEPNYPNILNCDNPANVLGPDSDGQYAHLFTNNTCDRGYIIGHFGNYTLGDCYVTAYSAAGYTSLLRVYLQYVGQSNWELMYSNDITSSTPTDIFVGTLSSNIAAISICVYDDGNTASLYVDNVYILKDHHYIAGGSCHATTGAGVVYDLEYLGGPENDGLYACLSVQNCGDSVTLWLGMEEYFAGTYLVMRTYSEDGYSAHLTIKTTDGMYFLTVYDGYVSSSAPFDLSGYVGYFHGLEITVENTGDDPVALYIDTIFAYPY